MCAVSLHATPAASIACPPEIKFPIIIILKDPDDQEITIYGAHDSSMPAVEV